MNRFNQHVNNTMSYQARGWHLGDGVTLPAWVTDEYEVCNYHYQAALQIKRDREEAKRKEAERKAKSKGHSGGVSRKR